jgi:hypothetical protein
MDSKLVCWAMELAMLEQHNRTHKLKNQLGEKKYHLFSSTSQDS